MVVNVISLGAVGRTECNWGGASAEDFRPSGGVADLRGVVREVDVERARTPYQLKKRPVHSLRQAKRDAGCVGEAHLLGVDWRVLCLLSIRVLQQVSGRTSVPE